VKAAQVFPAGITEP